MTLTKDGKPVVDLDDWERRAGPKRRDQWVDDRSAKELARCWLAVTGPALPREIEATLASHPAFGRVCAWEAEPEAQLHFDDLPGEPRNADLAIQLRDELGDFVMTVEGKADEPFGATVAETLAAAVERKLENPASQGVRRVEQLAASLFGRRKDLNGEIPGARARYEPFLGDLRYQLLTATAGTLRWAEERRVSRAVLLVQEFCTKLTTEAKHAANGRDLNAFVTRLSHGQVSIVEPGVLYGPFTVPGARLFEAPPAIFIGKVQRNLRA